MGAGIKISEEFFSKFGKKYPPESFLAKEGEKGDTMFIIYSGKVNVVKATPAGDKILATLGDGDFFGEMALMGAINHRNASVKTVRETQVLELNRSAFETIIRRSPDLAMRVIQSLAERLRDANGIATATIHANELIRISTYLRHLAQDRGREATESKPGRIFRMKTEDVSSILAIRPEVLRNYLHCAFKTRIIGQCGDWYWVPYPQYLLPLGQFMTENP